MTWTDFKEALRAHFVTWWNAAGTIPYAGSTIDPPPVVWDNPGFSPSGEPFVDVDFISVDRERHGPATVPTYHGAGIIQVGLYVPIGTGSALTDRLRDRVAQAWAAASIAQFHPYETTAPMPQPAPPAGYWAKRCDTRFTWISNDD